MSEEPRKRSRFDQTGPAPAEKKGRFDRRSQSPQRSPAAVKSIESTTEEADAKKLDPAAAAAAAAAKINAQLAKQKGAQHVDVPPIRATSAGAAKSPSAGEPTAPLNAEIYQQDGDFIKDIEVNDLRNRYTLTKGSTQKMIKDETGADVTTRGSYYPDKAMATPEKPPLYLHVTSTTKDGLEQAVKKIDELMQQDLPNLIDERRFRRRDDEPRREAPELDHRGRRKWPEERIPIDLEPIPGFNLRAQVVGAGGSYVKHIQQETRCRVQIKGRGSGFLEHETGQESDEQMYLHVAGPEQAMVDAAKEQCISLLEAVRESYEAFKERGPPNRGGGGGGFGGERGGYGGDRGGYGGDRGGDRQNSGSYGGGGGGYGGAGNYGGGGYGAQQGYGQPAAAGYGGAQSPVAVQTPATPVDQNDQKAQFEAWSAYYAMNPTADPYIQYGGYAVVMAQYMNGAFASATPDQTQMGNGGVAPPPPPPDDGNSAPPPPPGTAGPPGMSGGGPPGAYGYNSVPPPPGV